MAPDGALSERSAAGPSGPAAEPPGAAARIEPVPAAATHALRRQVLRANDPAAAVVFPGDDDEHAVHLGARVEGELVGVASFLPQPDPDGTTPAVRVRGMAVVEAHRGEGIGGLMLEEGLRRFTGRAWANARVEVVGWYEQRGFEAVGPTFTTPDTGLPHRYVRRSLGPPPGR
jgi:GNAT superfamily N-acetyltransferase